MIRASSLQRTAAAVSLMCALSAAGQSNVDSVSKHAWCENIGWTNWRGAGSTPGDDGVFIAGTYLAGFVWAENAGWINLGDGDPGAPAGTEIHYTNLTGLDFGVNLDPVTKELFGLAWAENFGWINFNGGALATPPNPARIHGLRLRGFAWSENAGWINLDDNSLFVAFSCEPCDANCDGTLNPFDIQPFLDLLAPFPPPPCSPCSGDANDDGTLNPFDIQGFLDCLG